MQATARAWQKARADEMDEVFLSPLCAPFAPRDNTPLSPADSAAIRVMYREMSECMQQWAVSGDKRVDTDRLLTTINAHTAAARLTQASPGAQTHTRKRTRGDEWLYVR